MLSKKCTLYTKEQEMHNRYVFANLHPIPSSNREVLPQGKLLMKKTWKNVLSPNQFSFNFMPAYFKKNEFSLSSAYLKNKKKYFLP